MLSVYVNREYLVLNLYTEIVVCEQKTRVIVIAVTVQDKKNGREYFVVCDIILREMKQKDGFLDCVF